MDIDDFLKKVLKTAHDNEHENLTALFMLKDHKDIENEYGELEEFKNEVKREMEDLATMVKEKEKFINKKYQTLHKRVWGNVEEKMAARGLMPENYNKKTDDEYLSMRDGVMYHIKKSKCSDEN